MTVPSFKVLIIALMTTLFAGTATAAVGDSAMEVLKAYLDAAVASVNEEYEKNSKGEEQSNQTIQSFQSDYWVSSRKTTIEGRDSGAAFVFLMAFRPDSWEMEEFRQAGDFGEIKVVFSRTRTFRSGEQKTTTANGYFEFMHIEDEWYISTFRKAEVKAEAEAEAPGATQPKEAADAPPVVADGAGPGQLVQRQLDILQGVSAQDLSSASKKSEPLWQDTRDARRGLGRVVAMVAAISSYIEGPIEWKISTLEADENKAVIRADINSDKALAFSGLVFTVEKSNGNWLLSDAVVTH